MNITELQPWLNVDMKAIEEKVQWLVSRNHTYHLVTGELISKYRCFSSSSPVTLSLSLFLFHSDYLEGIAREIAASLAERGALSVADIVNRYTLPTHFVTEARRSPASHRWSCAS